MFHRMPGITPTHFASTPIAIVNLQTQRDFYFETKTLLIG